MSISLLCVALVAVWLLIFGRFRQRKEPIPPHWKGFFVVVGVLSFMALGVWGRFEAVQAENERSLQRAMTAYSQSVEEAKSRYIHSIEELAKQVPGEMGLCFFDPVENVTIEHNGEEVFEMASIYKLYVAWAVLDDVQNTRLDLGEMLPGWGRTIQDGLNDMITWSDNDSAEALGARVRWNRIEDLLAAHGLCDSTFHSTADGCYTGTIESTPHDVTNFLVLLGRGEVLDESRTNFFLDLLLKQEHNNTIGPGLSDKLKYGHKTGWLEDSFNDAGIIYADTRPFYISVMTTGWTSGNSEAEAWYEHLGHATDAYINTVYQAETRKHMIQERQNHTQSIKGFSRWLWHHTNKEKRHAPSSK